MKYRKNEAKEYARTKLKGVWTALPTNFTEDDRTAVTVAGAKSEISEIKQGMSCRFEYFGEDDLAPKADCK